MLLKQNSIFCTIVSEINTWKRSTSSIRLSNINIEMWVRVNQRKRFPPNVFRFLLQWVEPAGSGKRKSADVEGKTVTLFYPYPRDVFIVSHQFREVGVAYPDDVTLVSKLCLFLVLEKFNAWRPR